MMRYFKEQMINAVLTRTATGGEYVDGEWIQGADAVGVTVRIIAIQPVDANDMQILPQGQRVRDYVRTYADKKLELMPRVGDAEGDRLTVDSKTYEIFQVDRRRVLGNYHRIIMRNVDGV